MSNKRPGAFPVLLIALFALTTLPALGQTGEAPNLGARISQTSITNGSMSLHEIRRQGRRIFTTPFNKMDGFGESYDVGNPDHTSIGNRPTLANNGTFLRINGLDAQTCHECHFVNSSSSIPARLGVGGVGNISDSPMGGATAVDVADAANNGFAELENGRLINPPFIFGAGGLEQVGKEMTADLQALKVQALLNPDVPVSLVTKGVSFGSITFDSGLNDFDTSNVGGINDDLVVRPFGRKGTEFTTRDFDRNAMRFHHGIHPVETTAGPGDDNDGDGVANELTVGEMSALHIFDVTNPNLRIVPQPFALEGFFNFASVGCTECHIPIMETNSSLITMSFPDVPDDPGANIYAAINLQQAPMSFPATGSGGVAVVCFADLKVHDMGVGLQEEGLNPPNANFTTARLWGAGDTAPYLHDGRAFTLTEAIMAHGGEAQAARDGFAALSQFGKNTILQLLRSLRTPIAPNDDLGPADQNVNH